MVFHAKSVAFFVCSFLCKTLNDEFMWTRFSLLILVKTYAFN